MNIYLSDGQNQQGPYDLKQVNELLRQGTLPIATTLAWREGSADWVPLVKLEGVNLAGARSTATPPPLPVKGDATGGIIPYKNGPALISYYLGVFGLIPVLGFVLAVAAVILGIIGLRRVARTPAVRGTVHAWVGILFGVFSIAYHVLGIVMIFGARR